MKNNKKTYPAAMPPDGAAGKKSKSGIDVLNVLLIILLILQIGLSAFMFLFLKTNKARVIESLGKKDFGAAVEMLNDHSSLLDDSEVVNKINESIEVVRDDYSNYNLEYNVAVEYMNRFSQIKGDKFDKKLAEENKRLNEIHDSRKCIERGDAALKKKKYDDAIAEYKKISSADEKNYNERQKKINNVYDTAIADVTGDQSKSNEAIVSDFDDLIAKSDNKDFIKKLQESEAEYLLKWIDEEKARNEYLSTNGVFDLSLKYDKLTNSDKAYDVDEDFRGYIQTLIDNKRYMSAFQVIDKDFQKIKSNSKYFNESNYNELCSSCLSKLLEDNRKSGMYTGEEGAINLAVKLSKYKSDSVKKEDIIEEYIEYTKDNMLKKINEVRKENGISSITEKTSLTAASRDMAKVPNFDNLNDDDFWYRMDSYLKNYGQKYRSAHCFLNTGCKYETIMNFSITKEKTDSYLKDSSLTQIGIGLRYHEDTEKFDFVIIAIQP